RISLRTASLPELDPDHRPRLRAPARVQHRAQNAVDVEPGMQESGTGLQPGALYLAATPVLFLKCLADARQLDVPLALLLHRLVLGHAALQGIHVRRAVDSEPGAKEAVPLLGLIVFALGVLLKRLIEPGIGRAPRVVPGSLSRHPSLDRSVGLLSGLDGLL